MSLAPGTRLGAYEITAPLGAGGMGEVYRARDTRLNRDVAIKVLPDAFASDPERLARFKREAHVLAALNHPHIAAIYGLEETATASALILELVEGPTLADRIAQGPIPLDEALPIGKQICEALEAAHERGIVHRDLKPANIKLTKDATVKVLDFGLAKPTGGPTNPTTSLSPTVTSPAMTMAGALLGSAAYMSPEQAKGKTVDKRTDIWAFGCVLFEMLGGQRVFSGEGVTDVLAAIVRDEPNWSELPAATPSGIERVLRRCLCKDVRHRFADIADVWIDIEDAERSVVADKPRPQERRMIPIATTLMLAAAIVSGVVWTFAPKGATESGPITRFSVSLPVAAAFVPKAIAQDGRQLVYSTGGQLFLRSFDNVDAVLVSGAEGAIASLFFSPDGHWVGYNDLKTGTLKKIPLAGGAPTTITALREAASSAVEASWGPNGLIVFNVAAFAGLMKVSDSGGSLERITRPTAGRHGSPHFVANGRAVLFHTLETEKPDSIAILSFDTGEYKTLLDGCCPQYVNTGHLVFYRDGALWAVRFDESRLDVIGTPVRLMDLPNDSFRVSTNGTLIYSRGIGAAMERTLVWVDRSGREEALSVPTRGYAYPSLSPDASRVAIDVRGENEGDIWLWEFAGQTLSKLTFNPRLDTYPIWSRDGRYLLFASGTRQRDESAQHLSNAGG